MKAVFTIALVILLIAGAGSAQEEHHLFSQALGDTVVNGVVSYPDLCGDSRFARYMEWVSRHNPDSLPSDTAKLAFWINAYNAWTLKIVCDNYPIQSINELHTGGLVLGMALKTTVWDKKIVTINNKHTSLSAIEHKIIRPVFRDPRIHFALVCAAKGCPPLRNEAYTASHLTEQLDDQGRVFLSQEHKNSFDVQRKIASISPVFNWFKHDFGTRPEHVLDFIARYLPENKKEAIRSDVKRWKIRYTHYDWSLNE